jgi:hypothetical protein
VDDDNPVWTTEQVREGFCMDDGHYYDDYEEHFNRWLVQHDAEIARATEERIITLLEDQGLHYMMIDDGYAYDAMGDVIALIKGENK